MATIPTPEQGKPILDFSAGTFDGNSYLFQSRNGATEHVSGDDVADYVNTSRIYNDLETASKTPVGAINEVNSGLADKMDKVNPTGTGSFSLNRKDNTTIGAYSFAEGYNTTASGNYSHAEGSGTTASAYYCHAEGSGTTASGAISHAEGNGTTANHRTQHVFGEYNALDNSTAAVNERGNYVEIVGNGTSGSRRSNARTLDWSGNEVLSGTIEATGFGATLKQAVIDEVNIKGIGDIDDVNLSSPAEGDVLAYDSTSSKWVNFDLGAFASASTASSNPITCANSTYTECVNLTLNKGLYLFIGMLGFGSNMAGVRGINISSVSGDSGDAATRLTVNACQSGQTRFQTVNVMTVSSDNSTFYLNAWQNSGGNLDVVYSRLTAVKIGR